MSKTLIQIIASTINARKNCSKKGNLGWFENHSAKLKYIEENSLPSGSGIDNGTRIDLDRSTENKIVLYTSYHHMNEGGYYEGWSEHRITIKPGFNGIDIFISGRNKNDIKEYLHDVYYTALTGLYEEN